jgi:hypothetical protein
MLELSTKKFKVTKIDIVKTLREKCTMSKNKWKCKQENVNSGKDCKENA